MQLGYILLLYPAFYWENLFAYVDVSMYNVCVYYICIHIPKISIKIHCLIVRAVHRLLEYPNVRIRLTAMNSVFPHQELSLLTQVYCWQQTVQPEIRVQNQRTNGLVSHLRLGGLSTGSVFSLQSLNQLFSLWKRESNALTMQWTFRLLKKKKPKHFINSNSVMLTNTAYTFHFYG